MRFGKLKKWTVEELKDAAASSESYADTLRKLGLSHISTNYKTVKKYIEHYKIDITHFDPAKVQRLALQKSKNVRKLSDDEIFCVDSKAPSSTLRKRYKELVLYRCVVCSNEGQYCGKPLTLQIDHINGINKDNRLENLRFLCPNCHSQTETFGHKRR